MKKFHIPPYINIKVNNISDGGSINFGPSIHKGHQANKKIEAADIIAGDEFQFIFGDQINMAENEEEEQEDENYENEVEHKSVSKKIELLLEEESTN